MALNIYNIKKWIKMVTGYSVMHVNQNLGKKIKVRKIYGYYNNLTDKVLKDKNILNEVVLPLNETEDGKVVYFPIQIFQYGLGAYDLYLETNKSLYLEKFKLCVEWAMKNQLINGAWDNFSFVYEDAPYSAMCQGEGCSLLARAYSHYGEKKYYDAALRAIDFMLIPVTCGGTLIKDSENLIFLEYTNQDVVLNGWIFSLFGLYDAYLLSPDIYKGVFDKSIDSLVNKINEFDNGFWSLYDLSGRITSPFYHNLHIAQLEALYLITENKEFMRISKKWKSYNKNKIYKIKAYLIKVIQKIKE